VTRGRRVVGERCGGGGGGVGGVCAPRHPALPCLCNPNNIHDHSPPHMLCGPSLALWREVEGRVVRGGGPSFAEEKKGRGGGGERARTSEPGSLSLSLSPPRVSCRSPLEKKKVLHVSSPPTKTSQPWPATPPGPDSWPSPPWCAWRWAPRARKRCGGKRKKKRPGEARSHSHSAPQCRGPHARRRPSRRGLAPPDIPLHAWRQAWPRLFWVVQATSAPSWAVKTTARVLF
jgi:hypothetical protein